MYNNICAVNVKACFPRKRAFFTFACMQKFLPVWLACMLNAAFVAAQEVPGYEVYLMWWGGNEVNGYLYSEPWNISVHTGYDNQPSFSPDGSQVLFSSLRDGVQTDIYSYYVPNGPLKRIAGTPESEYSPEWMPDSKWISTVRVEMDGTQRLWRIRSDGRKARPLYPEFHDIGYYGAMPAGSYAAFVLPEPFTLQYWNRASLLPETVDSSVGRSLKPYPNSNELFYVSKKDSTGWTINKWKPGELPAAVTSIPPDMEDMAWSTDGNLFMAKGSVIYYFDYMESGNWYEVADLSVFGLKNIFRLAFSPDGNWVAFVAEE